MQTQSDIEALAYAKLADAAVLPANERFDSAYYLAGYAVELLLKARVCKTLGIPEFFDFDNTERKRLKNENVIMKPYKVHDFMQLFFYNFGKRDNGMDTKALINRLHAVFSESNTPEKKYAQIWLSEVDFGGLYHSDKFALNVRLEHDIERYATQVKDIITMLGQKAKEELKYIMHVAVYEPNDKAAYKSDDYIVYEESHALAN